MVREDCQTYTVNEKNYTAEGCLEGMHDLCTGCAFQAKGTGCLDAPACDSYHRVDGRSIIWVPR